MAFLIIKSSDPSANRLLGSWKKRTDRPEIAKQIIRDFGNGTFLTEPTGEMLALAWGLRKRYKNKVDVFVAELLTDNEIPYVVREVSTCLAEKPSTQNILEKVKDIRMKCSVSSNEISLSSFENPRTE